MIEAAGMSAPPVEAIPIEGDIARLLPTLREALAVDGAPWVFPAPPGASLEACAWAAAVAREPGAGAFTLRVEGLAADPAWRGRRCLSHERNLESLRFAQLIPVGALVVRRELMAAALAAVPTDDADGWRRLMAHVAAAARVASIDAAARPASLAGEPDCPSFAPPPAAPPRLLILGQIEVSASLYFDALQAETESVAFRPLTALDIDGPHLVQAERVVLVRELHRFWDEGVIDLLGAAGVPFVYFTDDNFLALRAERDAPAFYKPGRVRQALAGAAEVWTSTEALAAVFRPLHPAVRVWGPALDPALSAPPPPRAERLTVALVGGDFRLGGLDGAPMARLQQLWREQPLRLIATEAAARVLASALPGAEIVAMPIERSFRQFIRRWRAHAPDILLHPAGATINAPYKCPTAVVVAGYLGAVPVVAHEPAYVGWGEPQGVLRLGADAAGLALAAERARDAAWRAYVGKRLQGALARAFSAAGRTALIDQIAASPGAARVPADQVLARPDFIGRQRARVIAKTLRSVTG